VIRSALLVAVALAAASRGGAQERRVLTGATLVDGSGAPALENARIVIEDGRFTCVSGPAGCPSAAGDHETGLAGSWVLPGLVDTHVHLPLESDPRGASLAQSLRFAVGVTTVRDAGSGVVEALLDAATGSEDPHRAAPRIVVSARALPEYADRWGVAPGAPLVRHLVSLGVRAIKIKDPFDDGVWLEEIAEARRQGVPSYGHYWDGPPPVVYANEAIDAGISGLSHLMGIAPLTQPPNSDLSPPEGVRPFWPEFWEWRNGLWLTADSAALEDFVARMVDGGVWLEPLLASEHYWLAPMPPGELSFVHAVPRSLRDRFRRTARKTSEAGPTYPRPYARMERFVADFAAAGGILIAGSDGAGLPGVPGLDLHEEIRLLREAGLGPMSSLRAATGAAATALARPDIGVVEAGRIADALVYASDPLADPGALLLPSIVIKGGVEHDGASLRREVAGGYEAYAAEVRRRNALIWSAALLSIAVVLGVAITLGRRLLRRGARRRSPEGQA
jgi:hypothetical protein